MWNNPVIILLSSKKDFKDFYTVHLKKINPNCLQETTLILLYQALACQFQFLNSLLKVFVKQFFLQYAKHLAMQFNTLSEFMHDNMNKLNHKIGK